MSFKSSVFIAMSLDGFIARDDGSIDWLMEANKLALQDEDCGYKSFISTVDIMIMGRNSFEKVLSFDEWPYGNLPVIVLSSNSIDIPEHLKPFVTVSNQKAYDLYWELEGKDYKHIYIDGGITIQQFIKIGLVDELIVTIIPVLIGSGKRLFGETNERDIPLEHMCTSTYSGGFVQLKYRVKGF